MEQLTNTYENQMINTSEKPKQFGTFYRKTNFQKKKQLLYHQKPLLTNANHRRFFPKNSLMHCRTCYCTRTQHLNIYERGSGGFLKVMDSFFKGA